MSNDIQRAIERAPYVLPPVAAEMIVGLLECLRDDWDDMPSGGDVRAAKFAAEVLALPEPGVITGLTPAGRNKQQAELRPAKNQGIFSDLEEPPYYYQSEADPWGGANLVDSSQYSDEGIETDYRNYGQELRERVALAISEANTGDSIQDHLDMADAAIVAMRGER